MNEDDIRTALAPYREARASEQLRAAVAQPLRRPSRSALLARHPRLVAAGAAAVVTAAAVIGVTAIVASDDPGPAVRAAESADGMVDISGARAVVFADGTTVSLGELFDSANHERLQAVFAEHGAELVIDERPVAPEADGRVFSAVIDLSGDDRGDMTSDVIPIEAGVRVEVEVGRADPSADTEGLTLYEVFPEIEDAIVRDDPAATGQALEDLGFTVRWELIETPGVGGPVDAPPDGTVVVSVLGPEGQWTDLPRSTDTLMVEVATPDVAAALGH